MPSHSSITDHRACAIGDLLMKLSPVPMHSILFPTLSSLRFSVFNFMLRSMIYLNFSFVNSDNFGLFSFFYLYTLVKIVCYSVLKMLFLFSLYGFVFLIYNQVAIGLWVYFSVFEKVPLINVSLSVPILCIVHFYCCVVKHEVKNCDSYQGCFLLVFSYEVENCSFKFYKKLCWNSDGHRTESTDCFW